MLAFKTEVKAEFEKILSAKVKDNLCDAALGKLIKAVIADEGVDSYSVEVAQVSDTLKAELADEIKTVSKSDRPKVSVQDSGWRQKTVPVI